jgi:SAM-dependent methyltransferase
MPTGTLRSAGHCVGFRIAHGNDVFMIAAGPSPSGFLQKAPRTMPNRDHFAANRDLWDAWTRIHEASPMYDLESFRRGRCSLQPREVAEVGDVSGKRLLHLQCHFGQDTLSWARRGAIVTGVDFAPRSIALARDLASELDLPATFVCANVYQLPDDLTGGFDIVFTSAGVLAWLPDLRPWGAAIARCLVPGGFFYIHEFHPTGDACDWSEGVTEPILRQPYFRTAAPQRYEESGSYGGPEPGVTRVSYEWPHSLSEVVGALLEAGLPLEFLHEFPDSIYPHRPFLSQGEDGLWRYDRVEGGLPLMFSLKARKPGGGISQR